jgi:tripartite-type tricarboxylate transporter receptor subunit TctC
MVGSGESIRSGRLRPLATLVRGGIPSMPRVPTFVPLGYSDDFAQSGFVGLSAPVRTPEPVQAMLAEAFRQAMTWPPVLQRLADTDTIAQYLGPAEFHEDVAAYLRFWSGLVERTGLRVEGLSIAAVPGAEATPGSPLQAPRPG